MVSAVEKLRLGRRRRGFGVLNTVIEEGVTEQVTF